MSEHIQRIETTGIEEVPAGAVAQSKIVEIQKGTQSDFRNDAYYEASKLGKNEIADAKRSPAVEVTTENGAKLVINLPKADANGVAKLHPKATLAVYKRKYGKFPAVGDSVATQLDANGFWRLVL